MRASTPAALSASSLRSLTLSVNAPAWTSRSPLVRFAERPTRRSKLKASVKAARSMKEVKRELVSSSSDWKLLCWPTVSPTDCDAR